MMAAVAGPTPDERRRAAGGPYPGPAAPRPHILAMIAAGGAAGTLARHGLDRAAAGGAFPVTTLAVNVSGAFLLGLLLVLVFERLAPSRVLRPLLGTGLLGALTSLSAVSVEVVLGSRDGRWGLAAVYIGVTAAAGVTAAVAGMAAGRALPVRRP
jgi:fluoride exporter